jgi:hypothetical protein
MFDHIEPDEQTSSLLATAEAFQRIPQTTNHSSEEAVS